MTTVEQPHPQSKQEMKRQERLREQAKAQRKRLLRKVCNIAGVLLVLGGAIGLIIWQGIRGSRNQASIAAAASEGGLAPDFALPATTGETITLSSFRGKKNVLLYFHEGLSCDPCIQQMPELEKTLDEFEKMDVQLLSIAFDPVDALKKAAEEYRLKTPVLSYNSVRTEVDYNLLPYSMGMERRAGHTFVLVGTDGIIKWRKDYWPARGHMVRGGKMFVDAQEIVASIKTVLNQ